MDKEPTRAELIKLMKAAPAYDDSAPVETPLQRRVREWKERQRERRQ